MKTTLYNQHLAHRFGTELFSLISRGGWNQLEFAVAWARRSGTRRALPTLEDFLRGGGTIRGTVGIDIDNTSQEALADLLTMSAVGNAEIFVYHNEAGGTTFHPKLYLLTSDEEASLIVGSNNLTEGGLYRNTEVGVQLDTTPDDALIREAQAMLATWRDVAQPVVRRLDADLIAALVRDGYVAPEATLIQRRAAARAPRGEPRDRPPPLFGSVPVASPPAEPVRQRAADVEGTVLLMRVRRASESARRTQVQIPFRVRELPFLRDVAGVRSRHSGVVREFREARARGGRNTIKLELPEIDPFDDPVVRFEREGATVHYTAYDVDSPEGRQIMAALRAGQGAVANRTVLTLPSDPARSTWYRFV